MVSRLNMLNPGKGERIYFRTLLLYVKDALTFLKNQRLNDVQYRSLREASKACGPLEYDVKWVQVF